MAIRHIPLVICFLLLLGGVATANGDEICRIARDAMDQASKIRGLKARRKVACYVHNKDQVRDYLMSAIDTKIPPHKLKMEEVVYKALGVIPEEFDYRQGLIDLYLSQLGGYYDPEKDHFVMAGWMPGMLQTTIAVHELTHALQDQHYDLEKFINPAGPNGDELMAHAALVEGDATAVMLDYTRRLTGQAPLAEEAGVGGIMLQNIMSASIMSSIQQTPETLQMMLLFPYTSGLRFVHKALQKGDYREIDRMFRNPPSSTEEILHPEKYGSSKRDYSEIPVAEVLAESGFADQESLYSETMGEFLISALLGSTIGNKPLASEAASGWGGDRVVVVNGKTGSGTYAAVWMTKWDTAGDASQFSDVLQRALRVRFPSLGTLSTGSWLEVDGKRLRLTSSGHKAVFEIDGVRR